MKKYLLIAALTALTAAAQAKIWRVNNTPGIIADFTDAQTAHDNAKSGDTLQFEPSISGYGSLIMSTKLVLVGTGNFLADTGHYQYAPYVPNLGDITINTGADGSVLMVTCNSVTINSAQNILLQRCYIGGGGITDNGGNYLTVRGCFVNGGTQIGDNTNESNGGSTINISNNIFTSFVNVDKYSSATISNNIISDFYFVGQIYNSMVVNNVISRPDNGYFDGSFYNSNIYNNVFKSAFYADAACKDGSNLINQDMSKTLVNGGGFDNSTQDMGYQVLTSGPAHRHAQDGKSDCGAFGGPFPYHLAVQPPVPAIYQLIVPSQAGNTLNVTISTKANN